MSPGRAKSDVPWGAFVDQLHSHDGAGAGVDRLIGLGAGRPRWVHRFAAIHDDVPLEDLEAIAGRGVTPMITLEPWIPGAGVEQPDFTLDRILNGCLDDDLRRWALGLAAWSRPVLLRFAHEMNGHWYPWAVGANGNTSDEYRRTWRHTRSLFDASGANNLQWVWSPNITTTDAADFSETFPGNEHIDVLGIDGYNWGDGSGDGWRSPKEIFAADLRDLARLGQQPILVTEVACAEDPDPKRKPVWISQLASLAAARGRVHGFIWFDVHKERDWRIDSSPGSAAAFAAAVVSRERSTRELGCT